MYFYRILNSIIIMQFARVILKIDKLRHVSMTSQISKNLQKMRMSVFVFLFTFIFEVCEGFNSTCPPSGNLVDGLPLVVHNTDATTTYIPLCSALLNDKAPNFCKFEDFFC